jgi:hypothetical protein
MNVRKAERIGRTSFRMGFVSVTQRELAATLVLFVVKLFSANQG